MEKIFSKIVSGGQTGVDRAALDAALELGLMSGGWCPKGRRAEDGPIEARYPLKETDSRNYAIRTEKNILDSDGTLILTWGLPKGGTALTLRLSRKYKKPYLLIELSIERETYSVLEWGITNHIRILNVAGPRESEAPGIQRMTKELIKKILQSSYGLQFQHSG
jgi:hypothetical protein